MGPLGTVSLQQADGCYQMSEGKKKEVHSSQSVIQESADGHHNGPTQTIQNKQLYLFRLKFPINTNTCTTLNTYFTPVAVNMYKLTILD